MGEQTFWPNLCEIDVLHGKLMIRSFQRQESFTNTLFSNLKTLNMKKTYKQKYLYVHEGKYT